MSKGSKDVWLGRACLGTQEDRCSCLGTLCMYPWFIVKWPNLIHYKDAVELEQDALSPLPKGDTLIPKEPEAWVGGCKETLELVKLFPNDE